MRRALFVSDLQVDRCDQRHFVQGFGERQGMGVTGLNALQQLDDLLKIGAVPAMLQKEGLPGIVFHLWVRLIHGDNGLESTRCTALRGDIKGPFAHHHGDHGFAPASAGEKQIFTCFEPHQRHRKRVFSVCCRLKQDGVGAL